MERLESFSSGGHVLQRHLPGTFVTSRQVEKVRWFREGRSNAEVFGNSNEKETLANLWHPVVCRIEQCIRHSVSFTLQSLAYLLWYIPAAEIENIWHILDDDCQRLCLRNIVEKLNIERCACILLERVLLPASYSTELRPPNSRECLARKPCSNDIEGARCGGIQTQIPDQLTRRTLHHVARRGPRGSRLLRSEVQRIRLGCFFILLYMCGEFEPGGFQAQRESAAARTQLQHPGSSTLPEPLDLQQPCLTFFSTQHCPGILSVCRRASRDPSSHIPRL